MSNKSENNQESTIPTVSEGSNTLGDIRINHSVVASIVRLAALEVVGVDLGSSDGFLELDDPDNAELAVDFGAELIDQGFAVTKSIV